MVGYKTRLCTFWFHKTIQPKNGMVLANLEPKTIHGLLKTKMVFTNHPTKYGFERKSKFLSKKNDVSQCLKTKKPKMV